MLNNWFKKKTTDKPTVTSRGGYKIVAPPKSKKRREMLEGPDIAASGGSRTKHNQPVR
ncbi:MAG: hypothetical protein JWN40_3519 [Phycisphaerales bacterium]|nr:hypothetical protein [Phycisphaerales bacterium]